MTPNEGLWLARIDLPSNTGMGTWGLVLVSGQASLDNSLFDVRVVVQ